MSSVSLVVPYLALLLFTKEDLAVFRFFHFGDEVPDEFILVGSPREIREVRPLSRLGYGSLLLCNRFARCLRSLVLHDNKEAGRKNYLFYYYFGT
jgi:hypothetical protein